MTEPISAPRVRHMWSRLPNETPPANEPDGWLGQVPPSSEPDWSPTPAPSAPEPSLPGEGDDRVWDPANPPLYG